MKLDAKGCPTATLFLALLDAERTFSVSKDVNKVLIAFAHARDVAAENGLIQYEGLVCERAALTLMELGVPAAQPIFERAIECYSEWGAHGKVEAMQVLNNSVPSFPA